MAMYKFLTAGDLFKKASMDVRTANFYRKISEGHPFELLDGTLVTIEADNNFKVLIELMLETKNSRALNKIEFKSTNGKTYNIKNFAKSGDFGGKGKGSGTNKEDAALSDLKLQFFAALENDAMPYLNLKINNRICKVDDIQSTPGTPKSDFHFLFNNKEVFWISHKAGSTAKDFQQYGSLTDVEDMLEIKQFEQDLQKLFKAQGRNTFQKGESYSRPVKNQTVIAHALFGKNFHQGPADGRDNIDVLYQGKLNLIKTGNYYEIKSNHTINRGDVPTGDYAPYLFVRRDQARNQLGFKECRFFIVSKFKAIPRTKSNVI